MFFAVDRWVPAIPVGQRHGVILEVFFTAQGGSPRGDPPRTIGQRADRLWAAIQLGSRAGQQQRACGIDASCVRGIDDNLPLSFGIFANMQHTQADRVLFFLELLSALLRGRIQVSAHKKWVEVLVVDDEQPFLARHLWAQKPIEIVAGVDSFFHHVDRVKADPVMVEAYLLSIRQFKTVGGNHLVRIAGGQHDIIGCRRPDRGEDQAWIVEGSGLSGCYVERSRRSGPQLQRRCCDGGHPGQGCIFQKIASIQFAVYQAAPQALSLPGVCF